jgi:tetratricopeptide (TPR) repeat protein
MKYKMTIAALILLLALYVGGQNANQSSTKKTSQVAAMHALTETNQEQTMLQVQVENEYLQKQIIDLEKEVDRCRGDIKEEISMTMSYLNTWIAVFGCLLGLLGVFIPYLISRDMKKDAEKAKEEAQKARAQVDQARIQVDQATKQATQVLSVIEDIKKQVDEIKESINKDKKDAEEAAKQAKASQIFTQAFSEKNYTKVIELCTQAIEINPKDAEAYNNRGLAKRHIGDFFAAIQDYDKAVEIDPKYADAYCNRGNARAHLEDYDLAIQDYDMAIKNNSQDARFYQCRGNAKYRMSNYIAAIQDYDTAIKINPQNEEVYRNRANAKLSLGDYSGSLEDYTKVVKMDQQKPMNYENRAICYRAMAKVELDEERKAELIANAETDDEKARELKKIG